MSKQRKVEVFIAGCPLCDETVQLVKKLSCPSCNVKIRNLMEKKKTDIAKAKAYGINSVPTVVVDGKILDCCKRGEIMEKDLKKAGIGTAL